MKQVLANELKKLIGRFPTDTELAKAQEYLDGDIDATSTLDDIKVLLSDFVADRMWACKNCGEMHLTEDMHLGEDDEYYCNEVCEYEYNHEMSLADIERDEYRINVLR